MHGDVHHLELDVDPDLVNLVLVAVRGFSTPSDGILEHIVVVAVGSVPHVVEEGNALGDEDEEHTDSSPPDKASSNVLEDDENVGITDEGESPESSSDEPRAVSEQHTEELNGGPHVVLTDETDTVVGHDDVLSVEQVRVEADISHDESTVHGPGVAANLLGGEVSTEMDWLEEVIVDARSVKSFIGSVGESVLCEGSGSSERRGQNIHLCKHKIKLLDNTTLPAIDSHLPLSDKNN